jgi:hypothetical protein
MNLDYLTYPIGCSLSLPRRTCCSVVSGLLLTGLCSEMDDAGIATPRPPRLGLQSSHAYAVAVAAAMVVVVVIAVGSRRLAARCPSYPIPKACWPNSILHLVCEGHLQGYGLRRTSD